MIWLLLGACRSLLAQTITTTTIQADGPGDTYELLAEKLGGSPIEAPDCDHSGSTKHIEEVFDETLNAYVFQFYIHRDVDTDRCKTKLDRQRNEIKAYDPSPAYLKGIQREEVTYEWKFRIDEDFQPSVNFTHLFQLKAVGGDDDDNPLLTITPRKGTPNKLQLIHGSGGGKYTTVVESDLAAMAGEWVKVKCKAVYAEDTGKLDMQIQLLDGTEILSYSSDKIDMWRTGASFVRPKWGIYRSLNDVSALRDEQVRFADFTITEVEACPVWYQDQDNDGLGDPNHVIYACVKPNGYVQNNRDNCRIWYEDADGDGLGNPEVSQYSCEELAGYVSNANDELDLILNAGHHEILISPNPTTGLVEIRGLKTPQFLRLYDLGGKVVIIQTHQVLDLSGLKSGIYLLRIGEDPTTYKLIRE